MHLTGAKQVSFPNKETQFKKGKSGNFAGRPKSAYSLDSMVHRILEGEVELPEARPTTIREAVGADKKALEATIIVGLLQALQGDTGPSCCGSGATARCRIRSKAVEYRDITSEGLLRANSFKGLSKT